MAGLWSVIIPLVINHLLFLPPSQSLTDPGNLGCLFSGSVCAPEGEVCTDDGIFGRCKQVLEIDDTPPLRYDLTKEDQGRLTEEVEALFAGGYGWPHPRTQCVLQTLLSSFLTGREFSKVLCDTLRDEDLTLRGEPYQDEDEKGIGDGDMAFIQYKPSDSDPNAEFADEIYSPPDLSDNVRGTEEEEYLAKLKRRDEGPVLFSKIYNTPEDFRTGFESKDQRDLTDLSVDPLYETEQEPRSHSRKHYSSPVLSMRPSYLNNEVDESGSINVMRRSPPPLDTIFELDPNSGKPVVNFSLEDVEDPEETVPLKKELESASGFSEGGSVLEPNSNTDLSSLIAETSNISDLLDELDEWSFQRSERLDVKKPGPQFSTNNYAFQDASTKKVQDLSKLVTKPSPKPAKGQKEMMPSELPNHPPKSKMQTRSIWFQTIHTHPRKKGAKLTGSTVLPFSKNSIIDNGQYDVVDTTFTYIVFKNSIKTWKEGAYIVKSVANLLHVPQEIFTHERVDRNEVTFKVVEPNPMGWNAYDVAKRIDGIKEQLKNMIGVTVTSVGVGDKNKLPSVEKLKEREEQTYVVIVIVCGVLAALGLSAGVLYLTKKHGNKLANLSSMETEPSKHYQDLCRARMSGKNGDSGNAVPPNRVASLSRESDNSPSSRSSTSSWSEEPVLSNMDIATGQMVLSYMEDHLKNNDRLESEWAALCAYKADPCVAIIAAKEENKARNRNETAFPYDHARVVLNELSNITGSDYINASTITDHDPRNPAYIVTQGPLPTTAPDFWQMVWEQGCVVIVMLTRLVENENTMCHRYWPAEGSELYHIFEVHLVSEHIWCDDYLVRSFYLKNMKTGETRTVTQFHFLSWPDASIPQLAKPLLEFRRKVNKSFKGRSCPIVVHCSDGIGRSGTYCLLDMVLNRMAKGAKEIDVAATLEHIRDQRAGALATAEQFKFVLSAVSDELQAILRVLPQANQ